jgi:hypothetical protein
MKGLEWLYGSPKGTDDGNGNQGPPLSKLSGIFRKGRSDILSSGPPADTESSPPGSDPLPGERLVDRYWLKKGFSYALIVENDIFDLLYRVVEPPVSFQERLILEEVHTYLRAVVVFDSLRK